MRIRQLTIVLLTAFALAACGVATPVVQQGNATNTAPTTSAQATERPSEPAQTAAPAATAPPKQPLSPTQATAAAQPTAPPEPTAAPAATAAPAQATAVPQPTAVPNPGASSSGEILFLRRGALMAFDVSARKERQIAEGVREFSATPDGKLIALVRGEGRKAELWSVRRDGSALTQLTRNDRAEATLSWALDGSGLVFASAATDQPPAADWHGWTRWCAASQVHLLTIADQSETSFGPGCAPAFSPDGRRIAYATIPTAKDPDFPDAAPLAVNSIRLINRLGQNGWDFAKAQGVAAPAPHTGRVVYAPAWSPDGKQLVYHRFLGYQALVDINLSEIGGSLEGKGKLLGEGAGWLLPALFAPDGRSLAITEHNYSDARGFGGYDNWSVSVIRLEGTREIAMPSGTLTAVGQRVDQLPRAQTAAWSPDGTSLAAELPPGWNSSMSPQEPIGADGQPGEIWRWRPGNQPEEQLVKDVDFASPLAWLP